MTVNRTVTIWLNLQPGRMLTRAITYRTTEPDTDLVLENAFHLFNVGHEPAFGEPHPFAIVYRDGGWRSLSVGDVVQIDDEYFACSPFGWDAICPHPILVADADSLRYFHCAACRRTLRVVVIFGPLGREAPKHVLIGEADIT